MRGKIARSRYIIKISYNSQIKASCYSSWSRMANGRGRNEHRYRNLNDLNREQEDQNVLAETLATIQRRMAEHDVRMAEQVEEIWKSQTATTPARKWRKRRWWRKPLLDQKLKKTSHIQRVTGPTDEAMKRIITGRSMRLSRNRYTSILDGWDSQSFFLGSTDPLKAEEWLSSIETILDFMELNDRERVMCVLFMLKKDARHW